MARQNEEWDDEDEHEDIPITRRQKEREMADKIAKTLLPSQKIKFRFVKELGRDENWVDLGLTKFKERSGEFWKSPVKGILISEIIFQTLQPRKNFIDTVIHELAHASDDVRFHPDFDPWSLEFQEWCYICWRPHKGAGHDEIWHNQYIKWKGEIWKKKFIQEYLKDKNNV